ncbi:T9SS C-terminal target domain-containing protein [Flavobacterium circumlabens]|uniref:Secreted protein (Por secretion system target) n=1 Tax=Flavobacterium circumlabens TaxID=2133765 RepID=A0A4Y7UIB3_9FLAO|nr:Ig-like domain-containing protein [Flavobacterium circumlabens]TCN61000.1 putative secreted protein (Por secretion system target) [Flavobacterium circumlabens]TEB46116.1 T9SS C-terminal target domain-containing protein [Flavobacterium circumlabens]
MKINITNRLFHITKTLVCFLLLFASSVYAQDPAQYGTPYTGVPDPRDANIYQVHIRPHSASGTLAAVTSDLDRIKSLGINVLYLMPIYPYGTDSRSTNSPYCIKDFKAVGSEYGTLTDMRNLVATAHTKGMAVMLDIAVNGTSWDHPWTISHPEYYQRTGTTINQLANFGDIAALDLNNSGLRAAIKDAMRYWIFAANIDGYRCDFANNPPLDFWTEIISNLRGISSHNLLMLAEGDRLQNFQAGFDMNFGDKWFYDALKNVAGGGPVSTRFQTTNDMEYTYATGNQQEVRWTANHDSENNSDTAPFTVFKSNAGVVANFLVSGYMKGVPFLTSGQEVAFNQVIPWPYTSVKINWSNTAATPEFARILNFRNSSAAIRRGTMTPYASDDICAFTKTLGTEKVIVMTNLRNASKTFVIPAALAGTYKDAYTGATVTLVSGATQSFNAFQYIVLTNTNVAAVAVTGVTVSPTTVTVGLGSTQQLNATIAPANATNQNVTWTSSNTAVATVNASGLVSAVSAGTTTITVKTVDGNKTATSAITVAAIPVASVSVSPTTASLYAGNTQQLSAAIAPANATNKTVTWSSSNSAVATVNSSGLVTAVAAGTANITATTQDGNKTAVAAITVNANTNFTVYFYKPSNWGTGIKIYHWSALPTGILADASWPGVNMTDAGNGWYSYTFTNITSTNLIFNDGTSQSADLSRNKTGWYMNTTWYDSNPGTVVAVTGVTLAPTTATLLIGATQQVTPTVSPATATNKTVSYSSGNTAVATVNASGLITALAAGSATITVTTQDGAKTATCAVTVNASTVAVTSVSLSPTTVSLAVGGIQQLTPTVLPANATNKNVTYSSSNTAVATVNASGLITAVANGTATITVTTVSGSKTSTAAVTVSTPTGTYYTIKNRWTGAYLSDAGTNVGYGATASNNSYKWQKIAIDATYFVLKNVATGELINIEGQTGSVQCNITDTTFWSAQWSADYIDGTWTRIRNRWQSGNIIHVENQTGSAQYGNSQDGWYSAQWQLESTTASKMALNTKEDVEVQNTVITIYPNPSTDNQFQVLLPELENGDVAAITVSDMNGRIVQTEKLSASGQINHHLASGIYIVTINSKNSNVTKKLIVK